MRIDSWDTDLELDDLEKAIYQQGRVDAINDLIFAINFAVDGGLLEVDYEWFEMMAEQMKEHSDGRNS